MTKRSNSVLALGALSDSRRFSSDRRIRSHFALRRASMCEEDGGTVVRCGRDSLESFAAMLLSIGCPLVVREPEVLRETFAALAKRASAAASTSTPER